jgi:hypothetical protein
MPPSKKIVEDASGVIVNVIYDFSYRVSCSMTCNHP